MKLQRTLTIVVVTLVMFELWAGAGILRADDAGWRDTLPFLVAAALLCIGLAHCDRAPPVDGASSSSAPPRRWRSSTGWRRSSCRCSSSSAGWSSPRSRPASPPSRRLIPQHQHDTADSTTESAVSPRHHGRALSLRCRRPGVRTRAHRALADANLGDAEGRWACRFDEW